MYIVLVNNTTLSVYQLVFLWATEINKYKASNPRLPLPHWRLGLQDRRLLPLSNKRPVCSECNFSLTNECPNIFVTANYSRMYVRICSAVYIFTNEYPNIFVHVVYSLMNIQIYSTEKYWPNIMANEYKWIVKMRKGMRTRLILLISVAEMSNCLNFF